MAHHRWVVGGAAALGAWVLVACGTSAALTCPQTAFSPGPGFEECFACQDASCCAELQACEAEEGCAYCAGNPTDEGCVDPYTFTYYAAHQALVDCQAASCDLACSGKVPSNCVPSDCDATCAGYANGCS